MQKKIPYRNGHLDYRVEGSGKPVLLLHGFAEDHRLWEPMLRNMSLENKFILPDLPGSGTSAAPPADSGIEDQADVLLAILDVEKIDRCTFIGHSMGGYITLAFVEKYPERVNAFGLFHSTAFADNEEKKENRRKSIAFIRQHGVPAFIRQTTPNLFSNHAREQRGELIETFIRENEYFEPGVLITWYEAMMRRPDRSALLASAQKPVLFIIGEEDKAAPLADLLKQSHLPDKAFIHILPHIAHLGMIEVPEQSASFVSAFLRGLE